MKSTLWICIAVTLCTAVTLVHGQCLCRTPQNCPQAIFTGKIVACRLPAGKFGLCCSPRRAQPKAQPPPKSAAAPVGPPSNASPAPPPGASSTPSTSGSPPRVPNPRASWPPRARPQHAKSIPLPKTAVGRQGNALRKPKLPEPIPGAPKPPPSSLSSAKPRRIPFRRPPFIPRRGASSPRIPPRPSARPASGSAIAPPKPPPPPRVQKPAVRVPQPPGFGRGSVFDFYQRKLSPFALSARKVPDAAPPGGKTAAAVPTAAKKNLPQLSKPARRPPAVTPAGKKPLRLPYGFLQGPGRNRSSLLRAAARFPRIGLGLPGFPGLKPPGLPGKFPAGLRPRGVIPGFPRFPGAFGFHLQRPPSFKPPAATKKAPSLSATPSSRTPVPTTKSFTAPPTTVSSTFSPSTLGSTTGAPRLPSTAPPTPATLPPSTAAPTPPPTTRPPSTSAKPPPAITSVKVLPQAQAPVSTAASPEPATAAAPAAVKPTLSVATSAGFGQHASPSSTTSPQGAQSAGALGGVSSGPTQSPSARAFGAAGTTISGSPAANSLGLPSASPPGAPSAGPAGSMGANRASSLGAPSAGPSGTHRAGSLGAPSAGPPGGQRGGPFGVPGAASFGAPSSNPAAGPGSGPYGVPGAGSLAASSASPAAPLGAPVGSPAAKAHGGKRRATNPVMGHCVPLIMCPPMVAKPELLYHNWCRLRDGSPGVICNYQGTLLPGYKTGLNPRSSLGVALGSPLFDMHPMRFLTTGSHDFLRATDEATPFFADASLAGETVVNELVSASALMISLDQIPDPNSPTALTFMNARSSLDAQEIGLGGVNQLAVADALRSLAPGTLSMIPSQGPVGPHIAAAEAAQAFLAGVQPAPTAAQLPLLIPDCEIHPEVYCEPEYNYRTDDGTCNNPKNPLLGRTYTGLKRLLPNTYDDGLFAIRTRSIRGGVLPSARLVSERVLDTFSNELRDFTLSLMQFSQFVSSDLSHELLFRLTETEGIECCLDNGRTYPAPKLHMQCMPILVPPFDPFYSQYGQRCMSMVRSLPAPEPDCISRPGTPLNGVTSYLDSSNIYGSNYLELEALRANSAEGLMDTSSDHLLPLDGAPVADMTCRAGVCYRSGDSRVNQQSGLTVMHTIFHREHNRIATRLLKRHPSWSDEELFMESRKIMNAEWQHIVYNEWLPAVIGFDYSDEHGLIPLQSGFSNFYDEKVKPAISNSFSTAAMRFWHTMVRDIYDLLDSNGQVFRVVNITSTFFEPTVVSESFVGHARTLVARRSEAFDRNVAQALHEQFFTTNFVYGFDQLAMNIQRGRDHGTPTYAQVAAACEIGRFRNWGDLNKVMDPASIDRLRSVYDDVRDVDLFIGGIAEKVAPGAQVGPTFQCVIGQQFFDLRFGDRFFYDNGGLPHSFTDLQLAEIRKTSWARILCDTLGDEFGNDFSQVQPLAFLTTIGRNQVLNCNTLAIPHVDLSAF